jgi:hypothetical protein
MNTPNAHVGIVTGFYIRHAEPPSPETDGLGGMAHLAAGLANAGIPVTVITDTPCAKAVWAVVDALPMPVNLEVVSTTESSVLRLRQHLETGDRPITHLIAIERVAPASDGKPHREHGWDMSRETAPQQRRDPHRQPRGRVCLKWKPFGVNLLATARTSPSHVSSAIFWASTTSPIGKAPIGMKHNPSCRRPLSSISHTFTEPPAWILYRFPLSLPTTSK